MPGLRWTETEDATLAKLVPADTDPDNYDWETLAVCHLPRHTGDEASIRWSTVITSGARKGKWTGKEDSVLTRLVMVDKLDSWHTISDKLTAETSAMRTAKQCRERWYNHLDPSLVKGGWTEAEDKKLSDAVDKFGTKWIDVAKELPGRSENAVKNRWNSQFRRGSRSAGGKDKRSSGTGSVAGGTPTSAKGSTRSEGMSGGRKKGGPGPSALSSSAGRGGTRGGRGGSSGGKKRGRGKRGRRRPEDGETDSEEEVEEMEEEEEEEAEVTDMDGETLDQGQGTAQALVAETEGIGEVSEGEGQEEGEGNHGEGQKEGGHSQGRKEDGSGDGASGASAAAPVLATAAGQSTAERDSAGKLPTGSLALSTSASGHGHGPTASGHAAGAVSRKRRDSEDGHAHYEASVEDARLPPSDLHFSEGSDVYAKPRLMLAAGGGTSRYGRRQGAAASAAAQNGNQAGYDAPLSSVESGGLVGDPLGSTEYTEYGVYPYASYPLAHDRIGGTRAGGAAAGTGRKGTYNASRNSPPKRARTGTAPGLSGYPGPMSGVGPCLGPGLGTGLGMGMGMGMGGGGLQSWSALGGPTPLPSVMQGGLGTPGRAPYAVGGYSVLPGMGGMGGIGGMGMGMGYAPLPSVTYNAFNTPLPTPGLGLAMGGGPLSSVMSPSRRVRLGSSGQSHQPPAASAAAGASTGQVRGQDGATETAGGMDAGVTGASGGAVAHQQGQPGGVHAWPVFGQSLAAGTTTLGHMGQAQMEGTGMDMGTIGWGFPAMGSLASPFMPMVGLESFTPGQLSSTPGRPSVHGVPVGMGMGMGGAPMGQFGYHPGQAAAVSTRATTTAGDGRGGSELVSAHISRSTAGGEGGNTSPGQRTAQGAQKAVYSGGKSIRAPAISPAAGFEDEGAADASRTQQARGAELEGQGVEATPLTSRSAPAPLAFTPTPLPDAVPAAVISLQSGVHLTRPLPQPHQVKVQALEADRLAGLHPALQHRALSPGRSSSVRLGRPGGPGGQAGGPGLGLPYVDAAGAEALMSMLSCDMRDGAEKEGFKAIPRASPQAVAADHSHVGAATSAAGSGALVRAEGTASEHRGAGGPGTGLDGTPAPSNASVLSNSPSEEAVHRMSGAVPDAPRPAVPVARGDSQAAVATASKVISKGQASVPTFKPFAAAAASTGQPAEPPQQLLTARTGTGDSTDRTEGEKGDEEAVEKAGSGALAGKMRLKLKTGSASTSGQGLPKASPASLASSSALHPPLPALSGGASTTGGYPLQIPSVNALQAEDKGSRSSPRGVLKNSPTVAATGAQGQGPRSAATVSFATIDPRAM